MTSGNAGDLALPPSLVARIQAAADAEHRPAVDVLHDAVETYLFERRWQLHSDAAFKRAREAGLPDHNAATTSDHPRTTREQIAQGVRSLREGKGIDGEAFLAQMEAEFDELERQGQR